MKKIEKTLEKDWFNAQTFTWKQLRYKAKLNVSGRIIQYYLDIINDHKCLVCKKKLLQQADQGQKNGVLQDLEKKIF